MFVAAGALFVLVALLAVRFIRGTYSEAAEMPGVSFQGDPGPLSAEEQALAARLEAGVRFLAEEIGPRSTALPEARAQAVAWLESQLGEWGLRAEREVFGLAPGVEGEARTNLVVSFPAKDPGAPLVVFSAHYDTVADSPGADDNATGVVALLELAASLARQPLEHQTQAIELVFFDAEEAGWDHMGSGFHAQALFDAGRDVSVAVSLEMLGYFSEQPDSQTFPAPFLGQWYPDRGNYLAFVGNLSSKAAIHDVIERFRAVAEVPSEGLVAPDSIQDVGRSDHAQFWARGWPGLMLTDTANFRNDHYHTATDEPVTVDFAKLARITTALDAVLRGLATTP